MANWQNRFRYSYKRKKRIGGAKPDYALKYKDVDSFNIEAKRLKSLNKYWEWRKSQPMTDADYETWIEYYTLTKQTDKKEQLEQEREIKKQIDTEERKKQNG